MTAVWEPNTSFSIVLQLNMAASDTVTLCMSSTQSQTKLKVKSNLCTVTILRSQQRKAEERSTSWNYFVQQWCPLLKVREETQGENVPQNVFPYRRKAMEIINHFEMTLIFPTSNHNFITCLKSMTFSTMQKNPLCI